MSGGLAGDAQLQKPSGVDCFMPSTVIRRFDYRPETHELEILFTTGRRYVYSNVPKQAVEDFRAAFSKGIYFNHHIRDCYPCRELDRIS
jgi:hypothetical protein